MSPKKVFWLIILAFVVLSLIGVATNIISFGVDNTIDFAKEQQPDAKSVGELIGKQYSQLRELSAALDNLACKIDINEQATIDLIDVYGTDESDWPDDARAEARNLRWEHSTLLQQYSNVAADYNTLRTDVRTIADNLGLNVDFVEAAEANSPTPGMCNNFTLPEETP